MSTDDRRRRLMRQALHLLNEVDLRYPRLGW
jgi:hypothetical protein